MSEVTALQFDLIPPSDDQFRELVADLGDEERHVLLEHGTEAPFCGIFLDEKQPGVYTCRLCGLPLFKGGAKFESGTGWPSFRSEEHTSELQSLMRISYAVFCLKKEGQISHIKRMEKAPQPTTLRMLRDHIYVPQL